MPALQRAAPVGSCGRDLQEEALGSPGDAGTQGKKHWGKTKTRFSGMQRIGKAVKGGNLQNVDHDKAGGRGMAEAVR